MSGKMDQSKGRIKETAGVITEDTLPQARGEAGSSGGESKGNSGESGGENTKRTNQQHLLEPNQVEGVDCLSQQEEL